MFGIHSVFTHKKTFDRKYFDILCTFPLLFVHMRNIENIEYPNYQIQVLSILKTDFLEVLSIL